ncbi:DoxX family protein [Candidatus Giovannonibacteria bacterium]|nr:DoxX family protein [Candidatus Giovannonibacteria bacterium]
MVSLFPQFLDYSFFGPTILRLALAIIFLAHGWKKIAYDKSAFAGWLESLKFRPGKFWAWVVSLSEFLGGCLLLLGFLTQLAAIVLAIQFLIIILWVRRGQPFMPKPEAPGMSWEFDWLILLCLLALLVLGPGAWALDLPL